MKSWFTNLRISSALEAVHKLLGVARRNLSGPEQLYAVEKELAALDRALNRDVPSTEAPPGLHGSIMRAVRVAQRSEAAPGGRAAALWLAAPVGAALVLMAGWLALRGPAPPPARGTHSLAAATTALEMSGQLAQTVPSAVVAPLSDELERLNRDLDNTAQFILASLP